MTLSEIKNKIEQGRGALVQIQTQIDDTTKTLKQAESLRDSIEKAQAIIQKTAKETQETLRYHIEDIVNTALESCFPQRYAFKVNFEIKRGKTEAYLYLESNGQTVDPLDASGGGVVDIISLALRLSCWTLGKTDNVLSFDEPFKFVSADLKPLAGEILKELSQKLGIQIIMVTHDPAMIEISDKVIEVKNINGVSQVA